MELIAQPLIVTPAEAGVHVAVGKMWDSHLRGNDELHAPAEAQ